jgi:DNA-directed RNA polymerase subunit H (RpoH/RPB5)
MQEVLATYARVNGAMHGDGRHVIDRVVKTCDEMLRDRGYVDVSCAPDTVASIVAGEPVVRASRPGPIAVYMHPEDKVGVKALRTLVQEPGDVVVVSVDGPTPFTRKESDSAVQFLLARHLVYNVTRHALVPSFRVVDGPPDGVTPNTLPRILETDPVVQYYKWPVGTVVHSERVFGGNEPIDYYRLVSASSA